MRALFLVLLTSSWLPGWTLFALGFAAYQLLSRAGDPGLAESLTLITVLFAVPTAAWLAGFLISRSVNMRDESFARFTTLVALSYCFASGEVVHICEVALRLSHAKTVSSAVILWGYLANRVVFCAALPALTVTLLILAIELPYRWVVENWRGGELLPVEALRPIVPLVLLPIAIQYLISLFDRELGVTSLVNLVP